MTQTRFTRSSLTLALLLTLPAMSACSWFSEDEKKAPLPGERISVLQYQSSMESSDPVLSGEGFVASQPWANEYWPQAGGYPSHAMQNLALSGAPLKKRWSVDIGDGSSDKFPLTAQPVVFDGVVYTLDTDSNLSAFSTLNGKRLWDISVMPADEDEEVIGGGLAVSQNILYVTTGYQDILAIDPKSGKIFWRTKLPSPSRAAPTIMDGAVYVLTVDNRLLALDAQNGQKKWDYEGFAEAAGLVGAASPAANSNIVVVPLSSGELTALRVENGATAWSDNLSPMVRMGGASALPDIRALPVIDKDIVIAMSYGGKIAAIEQRTGRRIWQRDIGGAKTPWVVGNSIFMISSNAELVALGRDSGAIRWVKELATFSQSAQAHNPLLWNGPVFAGGRLIVIDPDGMVIDISPKDGSVIRTFDSGDPVAVAPVVANETLYLLHTDGTLSAWK